LIVTVIGILGIETSSFIAIFASAGVAIGMALSGTLQNFAGGVLILLLKPYRIGDYIEAQGYAGTVREIQIFHTIISTSDNKQIIIPNGGLSTGSVNNYSRADYRRVDWSVGISYGDSVEVARKAILEILDSDDRIVKGMIEDDREERAEQQEAAEKAAAALAPDAEAEKPKRRSFWARMFHRKVKKKIMTWQEEQAEKVRKLLPKTDGSPKVYVSSLGDSAVVLTVRAWTRTPDYWGVYFSVNERIYNELPEAGINFPFPQMDVHLNGRLDTTGNRD
ncbi:MAG: mechanosensitive ion channel, partial [Muribaculaceae bacterium]|nr:mechanosensitive ion channel [Muribaculaceae bacterium]